MNYLTSAALTAADYDPAYGHNLCAARAEKAAAELEEMENA